MESKDPRRARQTRLRAHRARAPSSSSALPALVGGGVEPDTGDPACGFDDRLVAPSVERLHGPVRRLAIGASGAGLEEPCGRPGATICARDVAAARAFLGRTCAARNSAAVRPVTGAEELEFRCATLADSADLVELVESAYRGDASRAGWTTEADLLDGQRTDAEELASILNDTDARLLLATRGREILGCVLLRREPTRSFKRWELASASWPRLRRRLALSLGPSGRG